VSRSSAVVELGRDHVLDIGGKRSVRAEDELAQNWHQGLVLASQLGEPRPRRVEEAYGVEVLCRYRHSTSTQALARPRGADHALVAGAFAGAGLAGGDGGLAGDGAYIAVAVLAAGVALPGAGLAVQRGAARLGGQTGPGGEPGPRSGAIR